MYAPIVFIVGGVYEEARNIIGNDMATFDRFGVLYRYLTVQTYVQSVQVPEQNAEADIHYNAWVMYLEQATEELAAICTARGITLSTVMTEQALCHLVADYYEMGNPDWNYKEEKLSPNEQFTRGNETPPRAALNKLLDSAQAAAVAASAFGGTVPEIAQVYDSANYPKKFHIMDTDDGTYSIPSFMEEEE